MIIDDSVEFGVISLSLCESGEFSVILVSVCFM